MQIHPLWEALNDVVFPDGLLISHGERGLVVKGVEHL